MNVMRDILMLIGWCLLIPLLIAAWVIRAFVFILLGASFLKK